MPTHLPTVLLRDHFPLILVVHNTHFRFLGHLIPFQLKAHYKGYYSSKSEAIEKARELGCVGTFKLKELFSDAYRKDNGEVISTKEIKKHLKKIINSEDKKAPYTDEKLSDLLGKDEYHIARRTVAKYRESLGIETSKLRREL